MNGEEGERMKGEGGGGQRKRRGRRRDKEGGR